MTWLGILSNRQADGNLAAPLRVDAGRHPDTLFATPDTVGDIPRVLRGFADAGVEVLAVNGGDGTLRDVLSALPAAFGDRWPAIALLPAGKTNVVAGDVGGFGADEATVARLRAHRDRGCAVAVRHCLEISRPDAPPIRGFVTGAAMFAHATRMAGAWSHGHGVKRGPGVALIVARAVTQLVKGGEGNGIDRLSVAADGAPPPSPTPHFLFLASTLHRLSLGFRPFPATGSGDLRWVALEAPPRRVPSRLWHAWRGTLAVGPGCSGGGAEALSLRLDASFVVDGEFYAPECGGVAIRLGPKVRFLAPAARRVRPEREGSR